MLERGSTVPQEAREVKGNKPKSGSRLRNRGILKKALAVGLAGFTWLGKPPAGAETPPPRVAQQQVEERTPAEISQEKLTVRRTILIGWLPSKFIRFFKPEKVKISEENGIIKEIFNEKFRPSDTRESFASLIAKSQQLQELKENIRQGTVQPKEELTKLIDGVAEEINEELLKKKDDKKIASQTEQFASLFLSEAYGLTSHRRKDPIVFRPLIPFGGRDNEIISANSVAELEEWLVCRSYEAFSYFRAEGFKEPPEDEPDAKDLAVLATERLVTGMFKAARLGALEQSAKQ